jgi:hypothetical protein
MRRSGTWIQVYSEGRGNRGGCFKNKKNFMRRPYEAILKKESKFTEEYFRNEDYEETFSSGKHEIGFSEYYQLSIWNTIDYFFTAQKILNKGRNLSVLVWKDFINLVAELFVSKGWAVKLPKKIQNKEINIFIERKFHLIGLIRCILMLKKYSAQKKVGLKTIRELDYLINKNGMHKGAVITSGGLTNGALKLINENSARMFHIDNKMLEELVRNSIMKENEIIRISDSL